VTSLPEEIDASEQAKAALTAARALVESNAVDEGPWDVSMTGGTDVNGRPYATISVTPAIPESLEGNGLQVNAVPPAFNDGK